MLRCEEVALSFTTDKQASALGWNQHEPLFFIRHVIRTFTFDASIFAGTACQYQVTRSATIFLSDGSIVTPNYSVPLILFFINVSDPSFQGDVCTPFSAAKGPLNLSNECQMALANSKVLLAVSASVVAENNDDRQKNIILIFMLFASPLETYWIDILYSALIVQNPSTNETFYKLLIPKTVENL